MLASYIVVPMLRGERRDRISKAAIIAKIFLKMWGIWICALFYWTLEFFKLHQVKEQLKERALFAAKPVYSLSYVKQFSSVIVFNPSIDVAAGSESPEHQSGWNNISMPDACKKSQIKEKRDCRSSTQSETEKRSNSEELTGFTARPSGKLPK